MVKKEKENASWTTKDKANLINFLAEHVAAAGDGRNFKMSTHREASEELNWKRTVGGPKTDKGCKQKWTALKRIFSAIQAIKGKSGWTWTKTTGASIGPDLAVAWDAFVQIHFKAKTLSEQRLGSSSSGIDGTVLACPETA